MELNEKQFIRGFKSGYLLAKHEPAILTLLLKDIHPTTSYIEGMSDGQREYEQEIEQDRLKMLDVLRDKGSRKKDREREF